jgi:hypothetical protein
MLLISRYLMNVLRLRLQVADTSPDFSLDLLSFVFPFLIYQPLVYDDELFIFFLVPLVLLVSPYRSPYSMHTALTVPTIRVLLS